MLKRRTWRMALFGICALGLAGAASPGFAQPEEPAVEAPEQTAEFYGDWQVRCVVREDMPPCDMVQVATNNDTKEQVMRISIAHAGDQDKYGVQIWVPLGVLISGGVLVRVDDKEDVGDFKFTRCEPTGCFIEGVVGTEVLEPFRRGSKGVIAILDSLGEPIVLPLSFRGFVAAVGAMSARNQAWAQSQAN